jgi:hypothetical protein
MADLIVLPKACDLIASGQPMLIAGDAKQLAKLPRGQWIGGTTPYFMTKQGGVVDRERVFVTLLKEPVLSTSIRVYQERDLQRIVEDYPSHGCSFVILPAGSQAHLRFDRECATWPGLFNSPLVGWNSGVLLSELTSTSARVFDGTTLQSFDNAAIVLHATTGASYVGRIEIINPFQQGNGDKITFPSSGTTVTSCLINGQPRDFAEYLTRNAIDTRWPLVADYAGAQINVSFQVVRASPSVVRLYAPVFEGVEYRLAAPVADLAGFFGNEFAARKVTPAFSCNCILNFLYAELEGKRTGEATGPITFGEIAYVQLNQTLVYVTFEHI